MVVSNSNCIGTYRKCSACAAETLEYVTLFNRRFHNEWFTTVLTFHCPHSLVVRRRLFYSSSLIDEKFCFVKHSFQGGSPLVYKTRENLMLRCLGRDYSVLAVFFGTIRSQTFYTRHGFTVSDWRLRLLGECRRAWLCSQKTSLCAPSLDSYSDLSILRTTEQIDCTLQKHGKEPIHKVLSRN